MDSMIDKIRAAEQQAEDIRAQAATDARDMAARAREEAAQRLTAAAESERQKTREALAKAEEDGMTRWPILWKGSIHRYDRIHEAPDPGGHPPGGG